MTVKSMIPGLALLRAIDVLAGGLCRSVPTETETFSLLHVKDATHVSEYAPFLLGREVSERDIGGLKCFCLGSLVVPHVLYYLRSWLEVLFDFNDKLPRIMDMEGMRRTYTDLSRLSVSEFVPVAKYFVVDPMAHFLNNPRPDRPSFLTFGLFHGAVKRFLKSRLVSKSLKNASLFQGILQGVKRGCYVVPKEFIQLSFEKHRKTLSTPPKVSWGFLELFEQKCRKLWSRFSTDFRLFEASVSASEEVKRSEGGQRNYIMENLADHGEQLVSMVEVRAGKVEEVRRFFQPPAQTDVLRRMLGTSEVIFPSEGEEIVVNPIRADTYSAAPLYSSRREPLPVSVSAVLEPLKVRLITKGKSFPYWISKFFQKDMHSYLKSRAQFRLIGEPLAEFHLEWLRNQTQKLGFEREFWVSGDYSAATDGLKLPYTKVAFETALDRADLSIMQKDLLRSVLYEQTLTYPKSSGLAPVTQVTGQLMGSPLSFPILCVVNLVTFWLSLEFFLGRSLGFHELPVLVNGDDILFPSTEGHYKVWQEYLAEVGFSLSLGKNYFHKRFLTVNSELYHDNGDIFQKINYLNVGLLTGQSKLSGRESDRLMPFWSTYNVVIDGAVTPERAHRRFIHYNRPLVDQVTNNGEYSLFTHPVLGGLGCHIPKNMTPRFTAFQRRLALVLHELAMKPKEGWDIRTPSTLKGIIVRNANLAEPHRLQYSLVTIVKGDGPLWRDSELFLDPNEIEGILTQEFDPARPFYEIKQVPRKIIDLVRKNTVTLGKGYKSFLTSFPYRFVRLVMRPDSWTDSDLLAMGFAVGPADERGGCNSLLE
jgi:hypothetical protein